MSKVLVLHYSMYGHTADLAAAVAKSAHSVPGTEVAGKAGAVVDLGIDTELELARFQRRHVATVRTEVIAGRRSLAAEIHSQKVIGSAK